MDESLPCSAFLGQVCMTGPRALGRCQVAAGRASPQPGFGSPSLQPSGRRRSHSGLDTSTRDLSIGQRPPAAASLTFVAAKESIIPPPSCTPIELSSPCAGSVCVCLFSLLSKLTLADLFISLQPKKVSPAISKNMQEKKPHKTVGKQKRLTRGRNDYNQKIKCVLKNIARP